MSRSPQERRRLEEKRAKQRSISSASVTRINQRDPNQALRVGRRHAPPPISPIDKAAEDKQKFKLVGGFNYGAVAANWARKFLGRGNQRGG